MTDKQIDMWTDGQTNGLGGQLDRKFNPFMKKLWKDNGQLWKQQIQQQLDEINVYLCYI